MKSLVPLLLLTLIASGCASRSVEELTRLSLIGDPNAQFELGLCYLNGDGVSHSDIKAAKLFFKAAKQDFKDAQRYLGIMYRDGRGVPKNEMESAKWFNRAFALDDDTKAKLKEMDCDS